MRKRSFRCTLQTRNLGENSNIVYKPVIQDKQLCILCLYIYQLKFSFESNRYDHHGVVIRDSETVVFKPSKI